MTISKNSFTEEFELLYMTYPGALSLCIGLPSLVVGCARGADSNLRVDFHIGNLVQHLNTQKNSSLGNIIVDLYLSEIKIKYVKIYEVDILL